MKPIFHITIDRQELTNAMKDRVLSINVKDAAGYQNDICVITIDGRAPYPSLPKEGAIMEVYFGYAPMKNSNSQMELSRLGIYELDEVEWEGPPWKLILIGNAMSMIDLPKSAVEDQHEDMSVGEIVSKCAKRMGFSASDVDVHPSFFSDEFEIECEVQKNKTDMEFISELAQRYGAFCKVQNAKFRFHPKRGTNFVDEELWTKQCVPGSIRYSTQVRAAYGEITAMHFSYDTGKLESVEATPQSGEEHGTQAVMALSKLYDSAKKARAAVDAKKEFTDAESESLSVTIGGNPRYQSHRKLRLEGRDWHPDIPKKWIIVSSEHDWQKGEDGDSGYTTKVKCQVLNEESTDSDT